MMPISAVIPLFNKAPYIRRAIESVLGQTVLPDEIVVVDDGSTDDGASAVMRIGDSPVRLIQQSNQGECAARNRGVAEARHDLVAFLDADDEWKPDFLRHILRLHANFPDCGAYATGYEEYVPSGSAHQRSVASMPPAPWIGIIPNLFTCLQVASPFFPSSIAIPKRIYQDLGGFPVGVKRGGDLMMWIRLGVSHPIAYSPSSQAIYHTEAANRACEIFPSDGESECAKLLEGMLLKQEVPSALVDDLRDYHAILEIRKARELVKAGRGDTARILLNKVKTNKKHRRALLFWYSWSFVPRSMTMRADQLKPRGFRYD